jgi:hypothetical protein
MRIFVEDTIPVWSPYHEQYSVMPMDNAPVHMKASITAECAIVGVIPLFLLSNGYDCVELVINSAHQLFQRETNRLVVEASFVDATCNTRKKLRLLTGSGQQTGRVNVSLNIHENMQ